MDIPKLSEFDSNQQNIFLLVVEKRNARGDNVSVDDVIKEYYLRDQLNTLSVKH